MTVPTPSRIKRYFTVILRWFVITFVVFVLTILSGLFIIESVLHKVYTATAQIQVSRRGVVDGTIETIRESQRGTLDPTAFFQAESEIMESPQVLLPIINELGLDKAWAKREYKPGLDALPPPDALLPQDALAYMHKILKIDLVRGTSIANITVSSDVPKEAADIANAIADRYKTVRDTVEEQRNNRGTDALRDQIAQQQKIVDEKKAEVGKLPQDQSLAYRDAQRQFEQQQALLDALNVRLKQVEADSHLTEDPGPHHLPRRAAGIPLQAQQKVRFHHDDFGGRFLQHRRGLVRRDCILDFTRIRRERTTRALAGHLRVR